MAINACPVCGNARGSKDCEEACSDRQTIKVTPPKSLATTHYENELKPFIAQAITDYEQASGKRIVLDKASRSTYNGIMAKAFTLWLSSKK